MEKKPASYRHTIRIFLVIGAVIVLGLVARALLIPDTFGDLGHYRAAAVAEARQREPRFQTEAVCNECHDDIVALHAKDAHASVACVTCHGPGDQHVQTGEASDIRRPDGREMCLVCHRLMLARPGDFAQITPADHFRFVGVADTTVACTVCHSPHEPLYMDRDLRTARLHPLIHRCRDCHAGRTDDTLPRPADHPTIFQCDYCHPQVARDFAGRPHHAMRCTACHLFFRESESAGRIVRDADPRFCLLCHRGAPFRSAGAPPSIDWPSHREDMALEPGDESKLCIDCHQDRIHRLQSDLAAVSAPDEKE